MCLYDNEEDELPRHAFLDPSIYGEPFRNPPRHRDPPVPTSTVDPEVIEEMRKAGVSEDQIQELLDFHMAERFSFLLPAPLSFPLKTRSRDEQPS